MAWHVNATPGGSSSLVTWGPSAASAAPTAGIPAAASLLVLLLVLIGVVRALMLLCRLIALLPGLTTPRLHAQEILQVSEFVK
jgi:hypothetical protein